MSLHRFEMRTLYKADHADMEEVRAPKSVNTLTKVRGQVTKDYRKRVSHSACVCL